MESPPVEVDYGRLHDLEIEMPNLRESGPPAEVRGEAAVSGSTVPVASGGSWHREFYFRTTSPSRASR